MFDYNSVHTCSISLVPFSYDQFHFANVRIAEYLMVVTLWLFRIYFVLLGRLLSYTDIEFLINASYIQY